MQPASLCPPSFHVALQGQWLTARGRRREEEPQRPELLWPLKPSLRNGEQPAQERCALFPVDRKWAALSHLGCVFKEILKTAALTRGKQDFIKSWLEGERAALISHKKPCSPCHAPGSHAGKRKDSLEKINRCPVSAPRCALALYPPPPTAAMDRASRGACLPQYPLICPPMYAWTEQSITTCQTDSTSGHLWAGGRGGGRWWGG